MIFISSTVLEYPAPPPNIDYSILPPDDPAVARRVSVWANFPVAFCREAMNFYPHWYQEEIIADRSLFIAACMSRQIGKSESIAHKAIHEAFTNANSDVLIVAPTLRQARELYDKIIKAIKGSPIIWNSVEGRLTREIIRFDNGSRIINLAGGDEGVQLRGYSISLLIMEEAAFIPEAVFVAVEQALSSTGGKQILISTPYGKHNEFYRTFHPEGLPGYDHVRKGKQQIGEFSCYVYDYRVAFEVFKPDGTTQLSRIHVDRQKRKLPKHKWKAEYEADFIEDIDQYFPQNIIDSFFNMTFNKTETPREGAIYFFGIDIAKGGDYTSISIAELLVVNPETGKPLINPHIQIVNRIYWKMKHIGAQYPIFIQLVEIWKPFKIFFDKTSIGERPFEELTETHKLPLEGVNFSGLEKVSMYGNSTILMSMPGEIPGWNSRAQSFPDPEAKYQYENMVYEVPHIKTRTGGLRLGDTYRVYAAKGHDDIPDSDTLVFRCISNRMINPTPAVVKKETKIKDQMTREERVQKAIAIAVNNRSKKYRGSRNKKVFW